MNVVHMYDVNASPGDSQWWHRRVLCGAEASVVSTHVARVRENVTCLRCLVILAREGAATS